MATSIIFRELAMRSFVLGRTVHQIDLELLLSTENYTHSGTTLSADKLVIKEGKRLSVDNQLLVVTNE